MQKKWIIVGGAGFIGSHFVDRLLQDSNNFVTIYDNFSSGKSWYYSHHTNNENLNIISANIECFNTLCDAMKGHDVVIHLASNPDIAKAVKTPDIDFWQGTVLTNYIVEAMRISGVNRLLYASGSGVYGDIGEEEGDEQTTLLQPISTYGASKLSGESLIRSYCYMFNISACAFRFGNVVGARQTHGVGLDFTKRLINDSSNLVILGDGNQSKSYVHVSDVVNAVLLANDKLTSKFEVYNVATLDYITVNEIANIILECLSIKNTKFKYTGGDRGWAGDVPIVRLNSSKIRSLGWENKFTTREAIKKSILDMIPDIKVNKI